MIILFKNFKKHIVHRLSIDSLIPLSKQLAADVRSVLLPFHSAQRRQHWRYDTTRYGRLTCAQKLTRWPA